MQRGKKGAKKTELLNDLKLARPPTLCIDREFYDESWSCCGRANILRGESFFYTFCSLSLSLLLLAYWIFAIYKSRRDTYGIWYKYLIEFWFASHVFMYEWETLSLLIFFFFYVTLTRAFHFSRNKIQSFESLSFQWTLSQYNVAFFWAFMLLNENLRDKNHLIVIYNSKATNNKR